VTTSGFAVWASIIGAQTAYWVTAAGPLWHDLGRVWRRGPGRRGATAALVVIVVVILVVFPFFSAAATIPWPLWGHQLKVRVLTLTAGLVVGVPALSGIALVQQTVQGRRLDEVDEREVGAALESRRDLQRFLSVAGAIIGLAVLAAGALRRAVVPTFVAEAAFPEEAILLYGAFFTGLLTLVFVPAHLALKRLGVAVREQYFPLGRMPDPTAEAFTSWVAKRAALENVLQLHVSPAQRLQASLSILAPLLSAVTTAVLPTLT
jgi:hypothetical protein